MGLDPDFWRGRAVFLTGHTGFKGSWMVVLLHQLGARVTGFAQAPNTIPAMFNLIDGADLVDQHILSDIRDHRAVAHAMQAAAPDVVIHMAAQPLVLASYDDPLTTYQINVMGAVHLFEAVRRLEKPVAVVNVTSDKCYENREEVYAYVETDPMGGHDPYSNSKGCAELVTSAYQRSFFHSGDTFLASGRAGNVIGGGDWSDNRLVPDIIRAYLNGSSISIRSPHAMRPWQHVVEPVVGYLQLAQELAIQGRQFASGWNFGPDHEDIKPVGWVARTLIAALGSDVNIELGQPIAHEAKLLSLDNGKARRELGWAPKWSLETALERTAEWVKAYSTGANSMRDVTRAQLDDYLGG